MAIKGNIIVDQGATFQTSINVTDANNAPINLTGYSANTQMRKHYTSSNSVIFTTSISPNLGIVTISLTAGQAANIVAGRYVYDCQLTDTNGAVTRLVEGIVTVTPRVAR